MSLTFSLFAGNQLGAGATSVDGARTVAQLSNAGGLTARRDGLMYFKDTYAIKTMTLEGLIETIAGVWNLPGTTDGTGTAARFDLSLGNMSNLIAQFDGTLYVPQFNQFTIRKVTAAGVVTTLAGTAGASGTTDGTGAAARFTNLGGIAIGGDGNLYICDKYSIRKITPAGVVTTFAGSVLTQGDTNATGTAARFRLTSGIVAAPDGALYVATRNAAGTQGILRKVTLDGVVTTPTLTGSDVTLLDVDGMVMSADASGNLYGVDQFGQLFQFTPAFAVTLVQQLDNFDAIRSGLIFAPDGTARYIGLPSDEFAAAIYTTAQLAPVYLEPQGDDLGEACVIASTKVINQALSYIGINRPVSDASSELSAAAALARLHFADCVAQVLREFPWPFATRYAALGTPLDGSTDTAVNDDWQYAYAVPADLLMARRIVNPDGSKRAYDPNPPQFRMGTDATQRLLYADTAEDDEATLEYTYRPDCACSAGDALFREALAWLFASKAAPSLARNKLTAADCIAMYERQKAKAAATASNEAQAPATSSGDAPWISGR